MRSADLTQMRQHNTSLLLKLLWREGGLSRADLSRRSGLSRSTVSAIVGELVRMDLVQEAQAASSGVGRPPIALEVERDRWTLLGVDMGASHVAVIAANLHGEQLGFASVDHDVQGDPRGTLRVIRRLVDRCLDDAGLSLDRVLGIGLGVPCPVDRNNREVLSTVILPAWRDVRPGEMLRYNYGVPVFIENDANVGALAERYWGAGRGLDQFAYIKVATGVGSGIILDGEIFHGSAGIAGEIGHSAVDPSGPLCRCGLNGCLESLVGTEAILRRARQAMDAGRPTTLQSRTLSIAAIVDAVASGDALAIEIIQEAGRYLGVAVANLLNLLNPAAVVLGGSLTSAGEVLLQPLREAIHERALWTSIATTDVVISQLGRESVALGAAATVLDAALADPGLFQRQHPAAPPVGTRA